VLHPVLGANVTYQSIISRIAPDPPPIPLGGIIIDRNPMPVIVASSQAVVASDISGLATIQPSSGTIQGPIQILDTATVGNSTLIFSLQSLPAPPTQTQAAK
jgi:hypothetical protein